MENEVQRTCRGYDGSDIFSVSYFSLRKQLPIYLTGTAWFAVWLITDEKQTLGSRHVVCLSHFITACFPQQVVCSGKDFSHPIQAVSAWLLFIAICFYWLPTTTRTAMVHRTKANLRWSLETTWKERGVTTRVSNVIAIAWGGIRGCCLRLSRYTRFHVLERIDTRMANCTRFGGAIKSAKIYACRRRENDIRRKR